ncbi:DUF1016 domain-containing protein [Phyllobacterium zundukense]|uniref:DUF1016 domain-containing protein n=1 Tax=Phyllobacterium zundukense TaxID=1867719 RepID=A0ACD4CV00_9HYPH|nr:DUF1016 domain-containing protein [Phyllobacterium zundukense]UXN57389.1 DUF1016 domain-containing protein [Phyllobacterium zundukense]
MRAFVKAFPMNKLCSGLLHNCPGITASSFSMPSKGRRSASGIAPSHRARLEPQCPCPLDRNRLVLRQERPITNVARTLPAPQSDLAQALIRDPYAFDFLPLGSAISQRELEQAVVEHLRALILELDMGFSFVGSQDYFVDRLFDQLRLRCFVVILTPGRDFKPEFAGKRTSTFLCR